jgi:hypothetical protein
MVNNILILALGKLRLEDQEFKASQGNMVRHHLKKKKKKHQVAHTWNPNDSGGRDWEDHGSKPI